MAHEPAIDLENNLTPATGFRLSGSGARKAVRQFQQIRQVLLGLLIIYGLFFLLSPPFRSLDTFLTILTQASILAVLACGTTVVLISGGLDLSVGSNFSVVGVVVGILLVDLQWPVWIAVIAGLVVGTASGFVMGLIQVTTKVPAFIVTLGGLTAYRGLAEKLANGEDLSRFPPAFKIIGAGYLVPISIMLGVTLLTWIFLTRPRLGNHAHAIGGNEEVSRLSGVNVARSRTIYYAFGGLASAIAAIIQTSRLDFAQSSRGISYELLAIAAVVIGGTSLFGGRGGVMQTLVGMLILQTITVGLSYLGVDTSTQRIAIGVIIVLAVFLDVIQRRAS
jgi:ribose/xylose/arabinose/galactoside ABC-type transport system permease subunit